MALRLLQSPAVVSSDEDDVPLNEWADAAQRFRALVPPLAPTRT